MCAHQNISWIFKKNILVQGLLSFFFDSFLHKGDQICSTRWSYRAHGTIFESYLHWRSRRTAKLLKLHPRREEKIPRGQCIKDIKNDNERDYTTQQGGGHFWAESEIYWERFRGGGVGGKMWRLYWMIKQTRSLARSLFWLWLMFSAAVITEALTAQQWHQCNGATRLEIMTLSKDWITQLWHSFKLTQGKLQAVMTLTPWLFRHQLTLKNYCCMIWPGGNFFQ